MSASGQDINYEAVQGAIVYRLATGYDDGPGIGPYDDKGNENIVDMATLAFSSTEQPTDFGMAMKDSEFVLLACDPSSAQCDFSSSRV